MEKAGTTMVNQGIQVNMANSGQAHLLCLLTGHRGQDIASFQGISAQSALLESNPNKTAGKTQISDILAK